MQESDLADTYADFTTKDTFTILWKHNSLMSNLLETYVADRHKLGLTAKKANNTFGFFALSTQSKLINIQSATLQVCDVAELEKATYEVVVRGASYTNEEVTTLNETSFTPIQFTYDGILLSNDPSPTPTQTPTPSATQTPTPTPTNIQVVVTSAPPSATPTQNAVSVTTTFTPTPGTQEPETIASVLGFTTGEHSEKKDEKSGMVERRGEILGAQEKADTDVSGDKKAPLMYLVVITILGIFGLGALVWKGWVTHKFFTLLLTIGLVWIGTETVVSAEPVMLTKLTDSYSYPPHVPWQVYKHYSKSYTLVNALTNGRLVVSSTPDGTGNVDITGGAINIWHSLNNINIGSNTIGPSDYTKGECGIQHSYSPIEFPSAYGLKGQHSLTVRFFNHCSTNHVGSEMYLVFLPHVPTATPTITPTTAPTATPTPTPVPPFLDLPWDYKGQDLTFTEAALRMSAYFDHEYPTLSIGGSPDQTDMVIFLSSSKNTEQSYSSHDGYDFGIHAGAKLGVDQLAAAAGMASYHYDKYSGHAIFIDHGNGYQTRYYHMRSEGLIVNTPDQTVQVTAGQKIGVIWYSGNVDPAGAGGAHIHFMVIFDKNHDGNFADNIPDGLVDPYGWQGKDADPWETYTFEYPAKTPRTGMKSTYLWKTPLAGAKEKVGPQGAEVKTEKVKVKIPANILPSLIDFFIRSAPAQKADTDTESVGSVAEITAIDGQGIMVKQFAHPLEVSFKYTDEDVTRYIPESLSIYSSPDGAIWQKEQTLIDHDARTATAHVDHLTYFALMGDLKDIVPPKTVATLEGLGAQGIFRSAVKLSLVQDDPSEDIDYTLYQLDGNDWRKYVSPVTVEGEGEHSLEYFSADRSGNVEGTHTASFTIDQTPPEIFFEYNSDTKNLQFSPELDTSITSMQGVDGVFSVSALDIAGNIHTMRYQAEEIEGVVTFAIFAHILNDTEVEVSDLYAIVSDPEGGDTHEYLRSDVKETRIVSTLDGNKIQIYPDGKITRWGKVSPLQLQTVHDRLKIYEQTEAN